MDTDHSKNLVAVLQQLLQRMGVQLNQLPAPQPALPMPALLPGWTQPQAIGVCGPPPAMKALLFPLMYVLPDGREASCYGLADHPQVLQDPRAYLANLAALGLPLRLRQPQQAGNGWAGRSRYGNSRRGRW